MTRSISTLSYSTPMSHSRPEYSDELLSPGLAPLNRYGLSGTRSDFNRRSEDPFKDASDFEYNSFPSQRVSYSQLSYPDTSSSISKVFETQPDFRWDRETSLNEMRAFESSPYSSQSFPYSQANHYPALSPIPSLCATQLDVNWSNRGFWKQTNNFSNSPHVSAMLPFSQVGFPSTTSPISDRWPPPSKEVPTVLHYSPLLPTNDHTHESMASDPDWMDMINLSYQIRGSNSEPKP